MKKGLGIYVHIPYCLKKCPYCDFASVTVSTVPEGLYVDAVLKELDAGFEAHPSLREKQLETLYIGGGTPSLFSVYEIGRLVGSIGSIVAHSRDVEVTLEANPGTIGAAELEGFRSSGINRLSLGVQSFDDRVLKALGRAHGGKDCAWAFSAARDAGFDNIGVDLIFGAPGQTLESWRSDVKRLIELRPEHISLYSLTIEEGTPFHDDLDTIRHSLPSEDVVIDMFATSTSWLREAGYEHYELSNLALPGFGSGHNRGYWYGRDYLGLGAGAHSYLSSPGWGIRWWNNKNPEAYMDGVMHGGECAIGMERLSRENAILEAIFLGLRKAEGIEIVSFIDRFGVSPLDCLPRSGSHLSRLIREERGFLSLTPEGLLLADEVFSVVEPPSVRPSVSTPLATA